jgi:hypothetical protein
VFQAYDHAKNAIIYRDNGSLNAARESHEQAAGSFSKAADSTEDFEAIRLLSLLQEHHKQLSRALASSSKPLKTPKSQEVDEKDPNLERKQSEDESSTQQVREKNAGHSSTTNPALATLAERRKPHREPKRDLTSSLATNLAKARGQPPPTQRRASPLPPDVTAQHAGGKIVPRVTDRASATQRRPSTSRQASVSTLARPAATDTFTTFYNSLQGLYSKLPASLAFAGLPLTIEEETESQASSSHAEDAKNHKRQGSSRATADPDYSTVFSSSTIKALQEDARGAFAGHESFYVVPTSGGTRSYAGIVSGQEDALIAGDEDGDEFVDARESIAPPSPKSTRSSGTLRKSKLANVPRAAGGKTMEELELENDALRQLLDTQSRRLQAWEASAQSQSMRLAQSMRFGRRDASTERAPVTSSESDRIKELDEELNAERAQRETLEHQNDKLQRANEKLLAALGKYKDKWAMLKENARQRERNKQAKAAEQDTQ